MQKWRHPGGATTKPPPPNSQVRTLDQEIAQTPPRHDAEFASARYIATANWLIKLDSSGIALIHLSRVVRGAMGEEEEGGGGGKTTTTDRRRTHSYPLFTPQVIAGQPRLVRKYIGDELCELMKLRFETVGSHAAAVEAEVGGPADTRPLFTAIDIELPREHEVTCQHPGPLH